MNQSSSKRVWRFCILLLLVELLVAAIFYLQHDGGNGWLRSFLESCRLTLPERPHAFETFHFSFLGFCVALTIGSGIFAWLIPRTSADAVTDRVVFVCGVLFALLEIYKQLYQFFVLGNGFYDYSIFPFQFCSLPIYLCLLAPILRSAAVKRTIYCFLALFGTVGGYLVIGYPRFTNDASLCLHTMIWHSIMIALGVFLLITQRCGRSFCKDYLSASGIFFGVLAIATALNVILQPYTANSSGVLNLLYMSPYQKTYFLVIRDVQAAFGWGASMLCYVLLFLIVGALPLWILGKNFVKIQERSAKKAAKNKKCKKSL